MGWRFRKSVTLLPGVRVSFGLRGSSISLGPRGASVSFTPRGVYSNFSLPGTGLSYRQRLDTPPRRQPAAKPAPVEVTLSVTLQDSGELTVQLPDGTHAPAPLVAELRRKEGPRLLEFLQEKAASLGQAVADLGRVHCATRAPDAPLAPIPDFEEPEPTAPEREEPGVLERWVPAMARRSDAEHLRALEAWQRAHDAWALRRAQHHDEHAHALEAFREALERDPAWQERQLEERLGLVAWPRPTEVNYALDAASRRLWLDIDLPEFEDLEARTVHVRPRQWRLVFKPYSESAARELYARLVHGVVFRAVGEAFAALPFVQEVVASGFSQRVRPDTGRERDEYLLSVRMPRIAWTRIDFGALERLEVLEALRVGTLRRSMDGRHRLQAVEPFEPEAEQPREAP